MIEIPELVKEAIREGTYRKNVRINVMKAEDDTVLDFTIDNDTLVSESLMIDERMCSQKTLKFGLCEGTNIEFQYFDHTNISGRSVWIYIDCEYINEDGETDEYPIILGRFTIDTCSRQASTGIIKAVGYNKILSDYMDQKANDIILGTLEEEGSMTLDKLMASVLTDFSIYADMGKDYHIYPFVYPQGAGSRIFYDYYQSSAVSFYIQKYTFFYQFPREWDGFVDIKIDATSLMDDYIVCTKQLNHNYHKYLHAFPYPMPSDPSQNAKQNWQLVREDASLTPSFSYIIKPKQGDYQEIQLDSTLGQYTGIKKVRSEQYEMGQLFAEERGFIVDTGDVADMKEFLIEVLYYVHPDFSYDDNYRFDYQEFSRSIQRNVTVHYRKATDIERLVVTEDDFRDITETITLRDLQGAIYEIGCKYGKINRETDLFSGVDLGLEGLHPAEGLYPALGLYPSGSPERATKAMYEKLWADEGNVRTFKDLIITYKALNDSGETEERTLQRTVNTNGTDNYNMSDNWLFKNFVWTAESVGFYADEMVELMRPITWFPFEMWSVGLPHIETGDQIEIVVNGQTYTSYVLQRTMKGIQHLSDTYINGTLNIF